jgi:methionyl-tRNA formyltransferase
MLKETRILFFRGNNIVANQVLDFLHEQKENIIGVVFEEDSVTVDLITSYRPTLIITCYWPYLLKPEIIKIPINGCINFHPSLLPRNRGWYPAVWEVLLGGKAGVTLHKIDEGADTGPILAQKEFDIKETDTGGTVYGRSQLAMISLFKEMWLKSYEETIIPIPQDNSQATYHTKIEGNCFDEIKLDQEYNAEHLLRILKAKTFGDKSYAYYIKNGKKYYIHINITEEQWVK